MATTLSLANLPLKRPVKTALHQAVLDSRLHQVRLLVNKHGGNVDSKDVYGRTPLMLACLLDNEACGMKILSIFMKNGAYLNVKDNLNRTAFHYACMKGREEITRVLLKEDNVEINVPDNDGNTPLMLAALSGNPTVMQMMVDRFVQFGITTDSRNGLGYTALLMACKYGNYVSALILLKDGQAQPTLRDNEFYFNAVEWVHKSSELSTTLALTSSFQRSRSTMSASQLMPKFTRELTMYQIGAPTPICHHSGPPVNPLGQSIGMTFRLPAVFSSVALNKPRESFVDGCDARIILLKVMEEVISNTKLRPQSQPSSMFSRHTGSHPNTAKMRAMGPKKMYPDIKTIFRLYSEQMGDRPKDPYCEFLYNKFGEVPTPKAAILETLPDIHVLQPTPTAE